MVFNTESELVRFRGQTYASSFPECICINTCNITALLSVIFVILYHFNHSDMTFLSSKFILPDSPQDYLWSHYPTCPSLLRSPPTFQIIPYCLSKINLSSCCITFLCTHGHKFLTEILQCQTASSSLLEFLQVLS